MSFPGGVFSNCFRLAGFRHSAQRGFTYRNNFLAFRRVNRQVIFVRLRWIIRFQALVSRRKVPTSGKRRLPRHCREYMLNSISAGLSQLPCLGCSGRLAGPKGIRPLAPRSR